MGVVVAKWEAIAKDLSATQTRDAQGERLKGCAPSPSDAPETGAKTYVVLRARNGFGVMQLGTTCAAHL
jgi:hypothetical protein